MMSLADKLARQYGVPVRSIYRAAAFAEAVDILTATVAPDLDARIWNGQNRTPRATLVRAATMVDADPDEARRLVYGGKRPKGTKPRRCCPHCGGAL